MWPPLLRLDEEWRPSHPSPPRPHEEQPQAHHRPCQRARGLSLPSPRRCRPRRRRRRRSDHRRRRQVHEALWLLESAWQLVLPLSSFVLPRLSSQTCLLLLLSSLPSSSLYLFTSLVNMWQLPIEWQLRRRGDLVRAQACRVPTQRGIYLFSMIVDTPKVRSTCARCHEPLALLPLLSLCRPCPRPVLYCLLMHTATHSSLTRPLCAAFALRLRELGSREKKAKNEYVLLAGSALLP